MQDHTAGERLDWLLYRRRWRLALAAEVALAWVAEFGIAAWNQGSWRDWFGLPARYEPTSSQRILEQITAAQERFALLLPLILLFQLFVIPVALSALNRARGTPRTRWMVLGAALKAVSFWLVAVTAAALTMSALSAVFDEDALASAYVVGPCALGYCYAASRRRRAGTNP